MECSYWVSVFFLFIGIDELPSALLVMDVNTLLPVIVLLTVGTRKADTQRADLFLRLTLSDGLSYPAFH